MEIYIIQEDYTTEVEDAFGEMSSSRQAYITAIATSREDALKALAESICHNAEEYYDVDVYDYNIYKADVESGKTYYDDKGDIGYVCLTDEEKARVREMVEELKKGGKI